MEENKTNGNIIINDNNDKQLGILTKVKNIQILLKKESALKELCKIILN